MNRKLFCALQTQNRMKLIQKQERREEKKKSSLPRKKKDQPPPETPEVSIETEQAEQKDS